MRSIQSRLYRLANRQGWGLCTIACAALAIAVADCTGEAPERETSWRDQLKSLPIAPPPVAEDWLVSQIDRPAGIYRAKHRHELVLDNGLIRRVFRLAPNAATVALDQLTTGGSFIRSVRPECELTIDGRTLAVGGLIGQPIHNYIDPAWLDTMSSDETALQFTDFEHGLIEPRFEWKPRLEWMSREPLWPPRGVHLILHFAASAEPPLQVEVHYELYDGLPLMCKWFVLHNGSQSPVHLESFASEILACVEADSEVGGGVNPRLPNLHVETDCTMVSMTGRSAQRETVRWLPDPTFTTQVNYQLQTPCLLECRSPLGPSIALAPNEQFESFRTWILAYDSTDQTRNGLALCRMYRTIAPWAQENPLIFHVRSADPSAVRDAIDQAAEVGFELIIMTFGSGFNIESEDPKYIGQVTALADEAHARGVALGGYSLLASRSVSPEDDVINPETGTPGGFATFGNSPCLASAWGESYFRKLYAFFEKTGCDVLEHDGSYPGDACASSKHPGHEGYDDSYWRQREIITMFYRWCRGRGIYLNVPDWYFLSGSSKTGMGYRETNWSLPRAYQEIIERQNIHDGTRYKTPTMGWMFVPLTEYQGGGEAATIEPLYEHIDHYERRLQNLLGAGAQACFRGPRLFDTAETRDMVKSWVVWFRQHRAILESDVVPLRRPDGRDWDGLLHVQPQPTADSSSRGLAVLYNPLEKPITREIRLPLYYTGLRHAAHLTFSDGTSRQVELDDQGNVHVSVEIPAKGMTWVVVRASREE